MRRAGTGGLAVLAAALMWAASASAAPTMHLVLGVGGESELRVEIGAVVDVSVRMSGVPPGADGHGLFGMGFALAFDPDALTLTQAARAPIWVGKGFADDRLAPGEVAHTANRFNEASGPSGDDIVLATLRFTAEALGRHALVLGPFTGPGDNLLFDGTLLDASPQAFFGAGAIVVVPEPGSLALASLGLAVLARCRRR